MWGSKTKQSTSSEFFKGMNIFEKMTNSLFGKIKDTLNELFSPADIKEYVLLFSLLRVYTSKDLK